jgi:hypothetical protein
VRRSLVLGSLVAAGLAAGPARAGFVTFGNGFGSKWDDPVHGTPATVTWGFAADGTAIDPSLFLATEVSGTSNVTALRGDYDTAYGAGAFDAALERAFDTWAAVADVTFVGPVAEGGGAIGAASATSPDIRIAAFEAAPASGFSFIGGVGFGPPGDDLNFPDALAGDVIFNLSSLFIQPEGDEGDPITELGNDLENLFLHELGHAAMGLGHPSEGPGEVMYVGADCCDLVNREPSPDDIAGAQTVYGPSTIPACGNGVDDDGDGYRDFPADPACRSAIFLSEVTQCQDGIDNDGQNGIDFDGGASLNGGVPIAGIDPQCTEGWRNREKRPCGLGFELVLLAPLLSRLAQRSKRSPVRRTSASARRT